MALLCLASESEMLRRWKEDPMAVAKKPTAPDLTRCQSCGVFMRFGVASVEHVIPKARGGSDDASNLRVLCRRCSLLKAAGALATASNPGGAIAELWLMWFSKAPWLAAIGLAVVPLLLILAGLILQGDEIVTAPREDTFEEQLRTLDSTQASLDRLSRFISTQRAQMKADQRSVEQLQAQRKSLEPLVQADRRTVNALLAEQEARGSRIARRERWIGFGLGILGSILASALLMGIGLLIRKRVAKAGSQNTS